MAAAGTETLNQARARKEVALADLRQMEARKRSGELAEVEQVVRQYADGFRLLRSRLLAVPSRVRVRCPHLSTRDVDAVDREIRDALEELAGAADSE